MKRTLALSVVVLLALSGCGNEGVSQEEYDAVVAERDAYKQELDAIMNGLGDTQESDMQELGDNTESKNEKEELKLIDSGWSVAGAGDWTSVYYAVTIENPNTLFAVDFPKIIITVKDENGSILKNEEQVLSSIAAGDTITYGNCVSYEGAEPSNVEISVTNGDNDYANQNDEKYVKTSDFTFSNTSENLGTFKTYTGEITNNSSVDFDMVAVSVIYKANGNLVGGETTYIDDLGAGETKVFELSASSNVGEYDSYEFYAIQW